MSHLWLTSMSSDPSPENPTEMIEPILDHLYGIIWVLNDVAADAPAARYLETVKGAGQIIHRGWPAGRHFHAMNDTLFTGKIEEGDYVIFCDPLERPMLPFVSRVKTEIGPMMQESDVDVIFGWGKPFLLRYRETMEYRNSPHWSLAGWNGRGIEWSSIEPDEKKVRWNVRPLKRQDKWHWVKHYARYFLCYPAGSNSALLGLEKQGDPARLFPIREAKRLAFRAEMRRRGYPLTLEGLNEMLKKPLDNWLKRAINEEKTWSDYYNHVILGRTDLKDTHDPKDIIPIP